MPSELSDKNYHRLAQELDTRAPGGHSYARHGAHTTPEQQVHRAITGQTPDGYQGPVVQSSPFLSDRDQVNVLQRADMLRNPIVMANPETYSVVDVTMPYDIGEVYQKNTGTYVGTTSKARVRYDKSGLMYTAYPNDRIGGSMMRVNLRAFDAGIYWLILVVEHEAFDYNDWSTAIPLLPRFREEILGWSEKLPGWLDDFKVAYQYVLNVWTEERIVKFMDNAMNFGVPEPMKPFLIFVWEHTFPDEPWQRTFPEDVQEVRESPRARRS